MRAPILVAVLLSAWSARAFEKVEQGAAAVGVAGAETADADADAAIYYNAAALGFQRGLALSTSFDDSLRYATITPGGNDNVTLPTGSLFASQRIGDHFAFGLGFYQPYVWRSNVMAVGNMLGASATQLYVFDVNPTVAIRPFRWLSVGFGVDIMPTQATLADNFPPTSGNAIGGNAGLLLRILPRWLDVGFSYRSAAVADVTGGWNVTVPLPHTFAWGVASHPLRGLTVDVDVRYVLWQDDKQLVFKDYRGNTFATFALDWQNTVGVRAGAQYRFFRDHLVARVGGGWEQGPASLANTPPNFAIGDRGLVGGGIGARFALRAVELAVDAGYLATIEPQFTAGSGNFVGTYSAITHTVSVSASVRLPDFPWRWRPSL